MTTSTTSTTPTPAASSASATSAVSSTSGASRQPPVIELTAKEVQHGGVFCPNPKAGMKLWNNHPRVFIEIAHEGQGRCPYCGTIYRLKAGEVLKGH